MQTTTRTKVLVVKLIMRICPSKQALSIRFCRLTRYSKEPSDCASIYILRGLESSNYVVVYECPIEIDLGGSVSAILIYKAASAESELS
jgi:hypothetical protein